jgi:tetratricopeptide (TPR) repeat protein
MAMRAIGIASALCLAGVLVSFNEARAVVIVVGGGAAQECYATAEYGDPSKAFDICTRALSDQSISVRDRAATYVNRSVVRLRVRDYSGALGDVDLCIARQPNISEAYVNRGAALLNLDRPRDALRDLDKAITMGLDKIHLAYYNRGLAKERLNDARGAYNDYKKALEIDPQFDLAAQELKRFTVTGQPTRS